METLERFLKGSPIAARVELSTRVVVNRGAVAPASLATLRDTGTFVPAGEPVCDLEVGGQVVARGSIVVKRGTSYFQVREMGPWGES